MRVFQIEGDWGFDNLKLSERPEPVAGPHDVLVAPSVASLNSRDLIVPERGYGRATGNLPLIPVSDAVGVVTAVGDAVTRVQPGDRVCSTYFQNWQGGDPKPANFASSLGGPIDGVMADLVCLNEEGVVKVPDYLTDEEAATLPCAALTAWSAIATLGNVKAGDKVLIQGTGGVALFALEFAKMHGAHVTVISSSDEKIQDVTKMGADHCINYTKIEDWAKESRAITADRGGYDHIIELGGAKTLPLSLRAIRPGGTLSMIGVLSGLNIEASLGLIVARQVKLQGVTVGHRAGFEAMLSAMEMHQIRPVLGKQFAFEELKDAMDHLRSGNTFGKTLIQF